VQDRLFFAGPARHPATKLNPYLLCGLHRVLRLENNAPAAHLRADVLIQRPRLNEAAVRDR
jgi:hypothetical protein